MAITRQLSNRSVQASEGELARALNEEVVPIVRSLREEANGRLVAKPAKIIAGTAELDWRFFRNYDLTLTESVALGFINPVDVGPYYVLVTQTAAFDIVWPTGLIRWFGATPVVTPTPLAVDLFTLYFDGSEYFGSYQQGA